MNFKHGDKVTCYIDGVYIDDARISINTNGTPYICQNIKVLDEAQDKLGYKFSWRIDKDFTNVWVTDLKLADTRTEITWDNLQEGDVVIDIDRGKRTVLGVCGRMVFLSQIGDDYKYVFQYEYTKDSLKRTGYTIKQPIPDEVQKAIEHLQANGYNVTKE